jgi:hypothetical protein
VRFRCVLKSGGGGAGGGGGPLISNTLGPVEPSMPKMWDFGVVNEQGGTELRRGGFAVAAGNYTGGREGEGSEYWWLRVSAEGVRENVTEARAVPAAILKRQRAAPGGVVCAADAPNDPRRLLLTDKDVGCTLKAKCRPQSADGRKGELATTKPSAVVS